MVKRKKNKFSTSRYFTPRPVKMWKFILFFFTIFLDVLAHFKHIREKKNIFPLEKLKTLIEFSQRSNLKAHSRSKHIQMNILFEYTFPLRCQRGFYFDFTEIKVKKFETFIVRIRETGEKLCEVPTWFLL